MIRSILVIASLFILMACTESSVVFIPLDGDIPDGDEAAEDGDADDAITDGDNATADGDVEDGDDDIEFREEDIETSELEGPYPIDAVSLDWFDCPLYDDAEREDNPTAQCAQAELPLYWDRVGGPTIEVYYKRLLSAAAESKAQLWLLHGGPGASGVSGFPSMMQKMQADWPELDVYTIDHRGVGRSHRLGCPEQEDPDSDYGESISSREFEPCVQYMESEYGERLHGFSSSFAAIDAAAGIAASKKAGKPVYVWGGSYGSYLALRYLQIYQDQVDGVILEGIAGPYITFATSHEGYDKAGRALLDACMADAFCSAKFPDGVAETLDALLDKLDDGHCDMLQMDSNTLRYILMYLNYYHPLHSFVPAAIYRVDRCTDADALAFYNMYVTLFGDDGSLIDTTGSWSVVLNFNVSYSELWNTDQWASEEEMFDYWNTIDEQALFGASYGPASYARKQRWPTYTDTLYDDGWAETSIPILMLQGMLDPATPYYLAQAVGQHFNGENQTFVAFPGSPHNVTSGSPVSTEPEIPHCGQQIFINFLKAPNEPLDLSCLDDVLPINFAGDPELSDYVFGAADYWEADPTRMPYTRMSMPQIDKLRATLNARIAQDGKASLFADYAKKLEKRFARQASELSDSH